MNKKLSQAVSPEFIGGKDVMPITGFFGPYDAANYHDERHWPETINDEYFQAIADAGVNLIVYQNVYYNTAPELVMKSLDLGHKYGVGIFVSDDNIAKLAGKEIPPALQLAEQMAPYRNHPAFCGFHLIDEPDAPYYIKADGSRLISNYGKLANVLQQELGILCFSNMLQVEFFDEDKENYERYVDEFCETFQPDVIMWDYYVYDTYGRVPAYFWNLDFMRQKSELYQIPFWPFIQVGGRWRADDPYLNEKKYYPTKEQFDWNVNTCLAFGAKGIQYFPLLQPPEFVYRTCATGDFKCSGLIGANGKKNQWYDYVQSMNQHISVIDEVLMNSVNKGVLVSGEQASKDLELVGCIISTGKFRELESVAGDTIVGCFDYHGKTALYAMNYSTECVQHITLNFNDQCDIQMIQNAKTSYETTKSLTLHMNAGEGALIVIEP